MEPVRNGLSNALRAAFRKGGRPFCVLAHTKICCVPGNGELINMDKNEVVIEIESGMPNIVSVPAGVKVKVVDYDVMDLERTQDCEGRPAYIHEQNGPYEDL